MVTSHIHLVLSNMLGPPLRMWKVIWSRRTSVYLWNMRRQYRHHIKLRLICHRSSSLRMEHTISHSLGSWNGWWSLGGSIYTWRFILCRFILRYQSRGIWNNCTICFCTWINTTTLSLYSIQVINLLIKMSLNVKIWPQASFSMSLVSSICHQTWLTHVA